MSERITDIGPPHFSKFLPQVIKDNFGKWKYHTIPEPGVLIPRFRIRRRAHLRACRFSPDYDYYICPGTVRHRR